MRWTIPNHEGEVGWFRAKPKSLGEIKAKAQEGVYRGRALRRLYYDAAVTPTLARNVKEKYTHYSGYRDPTSETTSRFVPLVFTAGGGVAPESREQLRKWMADVCEDDVRKKITFRTKVRSRISIILIKSGCWFNRSCGPAHFY